MANEAGPPAGPQTGYEPGDGVLPTEVAFGWGLGTLGIAALFNAVNVLALNYMTNVLGIGAAVAGLMLAASKIYDAFTDPLMGVISDRVSHRLGRRRPFLLIGGACLATGAVVLFAIPAIVPPAAVTVYMGFALIFYATAYTVYNVPYMAMPAEMTDSYHERTRLISYRVQNVAVANIMANAAGPAVIASFASAALGHAFLALVLAVVVVISATGSFYLTRKAKFSERHAETHYSVGEQIRLIGENRPFLILLSCKLLGLLGLSFQSVFPFFFTKVAGLGFADISVYFGIYSGMMFVVSPGWKWVGKKIGKRNAFMLALLSSAAVMATWYFAKPGDPYVYMILRAVAYGVTACGTLMMGQALLPDTMEYDRRRTGLRREGIFAGLYTTVEKLAGAFGAGIAGVFFGAMGYVASRPGEVVEQPESAIFAIMIAMAVFPMVINLLSATLLLFYDLTEEKLKATVLRTAARAP